MMLKITDQQNEICDMMLILYHHKQSVEDLESELNSRVEILRRLKSDLVELGRKVKR